MLFKREFHRGLVEGAVTLTFRLWSGRRVKPGGRYRCPPIGWLEVDAVDVVPLGAVTDADAQQAGFDDRTALVGMLRKTSRAPIEDETEVYRIELHYAGPDEETSAAMDPELTSEAAKELGARLQKMDRLSRHGAWTMQTLALIAERPRTAASQLALSIGRETRSFKADVRKLKKLGLTVSHEVGYEISPRGATFLSKLRT